MRVTFLLSCYLFYELFQLIKYKCVILAKIPDEGTALNNETQGNGFFDNGLLDPFSSDPFQQVR